MREASAAPSNAQHRELELTARWVLFGWFTLREDDNLGYSPCCTPRALACKLKLPASFARTSRIAEVVLETEGQWCSTCSTRGAAESKSSLALESMISKLRSAATPFMRPDRVSSLSAPTSLQPPPSEYSQQPTKSF